MAVTGDVYNTGLLKRIFKYADKADLKYFFVEQDQTPGDPFDSITKSIAYIKQNLV